MAVGEKASLPTVAQPLRVLPLPLLTGDATSAAEVARGLDLTHASHHLWTLPAAGELIEAGRERIRGGLATRSRCLHERWATTGTPLRLGDLEGWVTPEVRERAREPVTEASHLPHEEDRPTRTPGPVHVGSVPCTVEVDQ